jgi:hypothetical protein
MGPVPRPVCVLSECGPHSRRSVGSTEYGSAGLFVACVLGVSTSSHPQSETCYPPMLIDDLALVFTASASEFARVGLNDPTACGYNFLPYATYETMQARNGGVTATSYEIEWSESSYASRAHTPAGRGFDYSLITASTHPLVRMPTVTLPTQFPA